MSWGQQGQQGGYGGQQGGYGGQQGGYGGQQGGFGGQGGYGGQGYGGQQGGYGGQQGYGGPQKVDPSKPFNPTPNKSYHILCINNPSLALDASKDKHNPNKLIIWQNNQGLNQQWQFIRNNDGTFSIKNS